MVITSLLLSSGSWAKTQVGSLGRGHFYPLSHFTSPRYPLITFNITNQKTLKRSNSYSILTGEGAGSRKLAFL